MSTLSSLQSPSAVPPFEVHSGVPRSLPPIRPLPESDPVLRLVMVDYYSLYFPAPKYSCSRGPLKITDGRHAFYSGPLFFAVPLRPAGDPEEA